MFPLKNTEAYIHANGYRSTLGKELAARDAEINELGSEIQALTNYVTENNVKNVYDIPSLKALSGRTNTGITYTVNDDGTVSVAAGTVSGSESVFPFGDESVGINTTNITNATHVKPNTKYIASFGVNLGAPYYIQVYCKATSSSSWTKLVEGKSGTEVEFTVPSSFYDIWVRLQIYGNGTTVPAMTLKPMIREARIDADGSYQPYAKTNVELTQDVAGLTTKSFTKITDSEYANEILFAKSGTSKIVQVSAPKGIAANTNVEIAIPSGYTSEVAIPTGSLASFTSDFVISGGKIRMSINNAGNLELRSSIAITSAIDEVLYMPYV